MNTINNADDKNNEVSDLSDLFEFLKYILGCTYISDLRIEPYNIKAKLILNQLNLEKYSSKQLKDVFEYIYGEIQ